MSQRQAKYKTTAAFPEPEYTQTPNKFFDTLPDMYDSEVRVTLVMIRQTFGFHRDGFKMGVGKLADAAGLSRQGALDGATAAEERGTFRRTNPGASTEAEWELVVSLHSVDDPSSQLIPPLHSVEGNPQMGRGQVGVKERIKKESKERETPTLDFESMTVEQAKKIPTLKMYWQATNWWPSDLLWKDVHETIIKHKLTFDKIRAVAIEWVSRSYKPGNVKGILEWAVNGIPPGKNGATTTPTPASSYDRDNERDFAPLIAYLDSQKEQS